MKQDCVTWEQALKNARTRLRTESEDAFLLLEAAGSIKRIDYLLHKEDLIPEEVLHRFESYVSMREAHIPLQYITGYQDFMGLLIAVTADVLIPRLDTEVLAEMVIKEADSKKVLDLCTGSGCLAVSIVKLGRPAYVAASDISEAALAIARQNAAVNQAEVQFIKSDMFENIEGRFDFIVSNPPYIPTAEINELMQEVKDHEPHLALDGREDGLHFYRIIAEQSKNYLNCGGKLFLEIGCEQADQVKALLKADYYNIKVYKDLAGLDRIVTAESKCAKEAQDGE